MLTVKPTQYRKLAAREEQAFLQRLQAKPLPCAPGWPARAPRQTKLSPVFIPVNVGDHAVPGAIYWTHSQECTMPDRVELLAAEGRTLAPEERVRLLDLLLESLEEKASPSVEAAWAAEVERRVKAYEQGDGQMFDVESVMAEAEKLTP